MLLVDGGAGAEVVEPAFVAARLVRQARYLSLERLNPILYHTCLVDASAAEALSAMAATNANLEGNLCAFFIPGQEPEAGWEQELEQERVEYEAHSAALRDAYAQANDVVFEELVELRKEFLMPA